MLSRGLKDYEVSHTVLRLPFDWFLPFLCDPESRGAILEPRAKAVGEMVTTVVAGGRR